MTRFSGAWHPRWNRVFIAGLFIASVAIGASLGFEERHAPLALAAASETAPISRPAHTRLIDTHVRPVYFVVPQPVQYSPYGALVTIPHIGIPAAIELVSSGSCDLLTEAISRQVLVTDDAGNPVAGANVQFTVIRSDVDEPQFVSDTTGFDGTATVTVKVPTGTRAGAGGSGTGSKGVATYSILAQAFDVDAANPAASLRFAISDYTCTGVAGGR